MMIIRPFWLATLVAVGAFAASPKASAQSALGAPLFAVLVGGNECTTAVPPVCRFGVGDPDAIGSATILLVPFNAISTRVCFGLTVNNLAGATVAEIHRGVAGTNGPVVVVFAPPVAPFNADPGASSGCVAVPASTAAAIRADPTSFYVHVHNIAFPGGAARGQLH
jgi:hypothetical protein